MLGKRYLLLGIALGGLILLGSAENQTTEVPPARPIAPHGGLSVAPPKQHPVNAVKVNRPADFTKEECSECHEEAVASFDNTTHARAWHGSDSLCSTCHGDATEHMKSQGKKGTIRSVAKMAPSDVANMCLTCHEKPGEQSHMRLSEHALAGVTCLSCHDVHPDAKAKAERTLGGNSTMMRAEQKELCVSCHTSIGAQISMPSHHRIKEGVVECTSCHNPHGTTDKHQLLADNKANCLKCHEDKRGPFSFEHNASAIDGCLGCHQPHGSSGPHLLKARDQRTLCISCHSIETGKGIPHGRLGLQATGDCTRCHSEIHGSNASPFFTQ
jgi:DmsE family decaheme c-type cytochrome